MLGLLSAPAAAAPSVQLRAQVGWSGWIPLGKWIPVQVELLAPEAIDGILVVEVPTRDLSGLMSFRHPVRLSSGVRQQMTLQVIVPEARKSLVVRFASAGHDLVRAEIPLFSRSAVESVALAVTREAAGLERLSEGSQLRPAYITEADLPTSWQGYAGVSVLVIHDVDAQMVSPAQQEALREWVAQGGRLVISGGEPLMRLQAPWLRALLPADPVDLTSWRTGQLPGIRSPVLAAVLAGRPGAVVRGPLQAWWQRGAGTVTVWAVDLLAPELRAWDGGGALWDEVLHSPVRPWPVLRDLMHPLPASRPLPAGVQGWFAVLAVMYIVAARRVLMRAGRLQSGWLLVPALAVLFAPAMYGFGLHARHVGTVAVQASVVEPLVGVDVARVRTAVAVLSPYGGTFELTAPEGASIQPVEPRSLTFDGLAAVRGTAPASGLQLDVAQIVPTPVQGRLLSSADGLRVEITPRGALSIDEPVVARRGAIYRLPRISAAFSARLDPAAWETFVARAVPARDLGERLQQDVLGQLASWPGSSEAGAWLVGRINAVQWSLRGRPMSMEAYQLVVVPLPAEAGPP